MRILFIDHTPFIGGAELALVRHIRYLDKEKFEPVVACSGAVPELVEKFKEAGAKVFVIPFEKLKVLSPAVVGRFVRGFREVWGILRDEKVDIVVTNTERAMYVGTLAAVLSGKKLVWWVRDFEYSKILFGILGNLASKIICVSKAVRDYYGGQNNPKFEVVYVGSDFDQKLQHVSLEDVLRVKRELGLTGARLVVGYVGRLVHWKGASVLLEAARNLKSPARLAFARLPTTGTVGQGDSKAGGQISNLKFLIVGTGEGQEGNVEPELRKMVDECSLQDAVIFTGQRNDVPVLMKTFDVFCHTSIEPEPFATVIVEAMMAGVPVIGTNIGGTPEIIRDGQTGFLVPPNDPQMLAAVLSYLAENQNLRQKIGREGRRLVLARNTEAVVTKQVERIYIGCLEDGCL